MMFYMNKEGYQSLWQRVAARKSSEADAVGCAGIRRSPMSIAGLLHLSRGNTFATMIGR